MKALRRYLKPFDYLILLISLMGIVMGIFAALDTSAKPEILRIQTEDDEFLYPLSSDLVLRPLEAEGTCEIELQDGSAKVISSACPKQICISMGSIDSPGEWIACLPHQVFIEILGRAVEAEVDAVAL